MTTRVPPEMIESPESDLALLSIMPIGAVIPFAGSAAPTATVHATYLLCYGQAVSRTDYATLFDRLGTAYGVGDGSTTFGIPDLRGRVAVGQDDMGGASADRITSGIAGFDGDTLGASGGDQRLHQHNHAITDPGHTHSRNTGPGTGGLDEPVLASGALGTTGSATTGISLAAAGTGASQNVQPSIVLNYLIRAL